MVKRAATLKARFGPNEGSSLLAVQQTTDAVIDFHETTGNFPFLSNGLVVLENHGLSPEAARLVQLLITNSNNDSVGTSTLCVVSKKTLRDTKGGLVRYGGLVCGRIVIVPERYATLGTNLSEVAGSLQNALP